MTLKSLAAIVVCTFRFRRPPMRPKPRGSTSGSSSVCRMPRLMWDHPSGRVRPIWSKSGRANGSRAGGCYTDEGNGRVGTCDRREGNGCTLEAARIAAL